MKRKLIDLSDDTFETLSADAIGGGTNLKHYIEEILDQKARCLEESAACGYRFTSSAEPSDGELAAIMDKSVEAASRRKQAAMSAFYSNLEKSIRTAK